MYNQIRYIASWTSVKVRTRLGQRGAEMVEYAVVLACIAVLGVAFYKANKTSSGGRGSDTLNGILTDLWNKVYDIVDKILK